MQVWTNKIRVTDPKRQGKPDRGLVLARWGGMGTHRYQVGFSGDVNPMSWDTLAYQPYFSLTAANVLYGYWSQ
jgi:alpha-glucosidase (family GH31 glycosyl hydrolase)